MVVTFIVSSYCLTKTGHLSFTKNTIKLNNTIDLPPRTLKPFLELFIWINLIGSLFSYNIQVVFLQESKGFPCLRKLSFLHTLTNIPVHKSSLCIHQIILRIDPFGKHSAYSNVVPYHGYIFLCGSSNITLYDSSWHFVQTYLETCRAPLNEADLVVLFEPLHGCICLFRLDITTVVDRNCHILVLYWVKFCVFDQHVLWLEAVIGNLSYRLCLMRSFLLANNRRKSGGHKMQPRKWNQVCLELAQVNVQFPIKTQRRCH